MHSRIALFISACALLLAQGCAISPVPLRPYAVAPAGAPAATDTAMPSSPTGLSIGELLQMLQARRPQIDIAADLKARGLRVAPAPADFDVLAAAGASPELLQILGATAAQAEALIANGGVAQGEGSASPPTLQAPPIALYDIVYPWVPFGYGPGFGYYASNAYYWGFAPFWAYPALRVGGWRYNLPPRPVQPHIHPGRFVSRGPGFRVRR